MTFNEKLIRLRKINSLTQDEFAKKVGVSRQAVYKWESGQSYPEVPTLLQIKFLFEISIDNLLDESFEIELPEKKTRKRVRSKVSGAAKDVEAPVLREEIAETNEPKTVNEDSTDKATQNETSENKTEQANPECETVIDTGKKKVGFFGRIFGRK